MTRARAHADGRRLIGEVGFVDGDVAQARSGELLGDGQELELGAGREDDSERAGSRRAGFARSMDHLRHRSAEGEVGPGDDVVVEARIALRVKLETWG
jgi:hypothetical protein